MAVNIMECRHIHLEWALAGYKKTGVPLIEFDGSSVLPSFTSDDAGIYCIIPRLADFFNLPLDTSIQLFFLGMTVASCIIGIAGFFLLYRSTAARIVSALGLILLSIVSLETTDVYRAYAAVVVALIPWSLYFTQKNKSSVWFFVFTFLSGVSIGFVHYIRAYSGVAALLFLVTLIITMSLTRMKKFLLLGFLLIGVCIPVAYFRSLFLQATDYCSTHLKEEKAGDTQHVFWHQVYIGLGFLTNSFGIRYDDSVADRRVQEIARHTPYPSQASEEILKREVYRLFKTDVLFFVFTLGAKMGILLLYFFLFANIGILAFFLYPQNWRITLAFFCALLFSSLFGILTIPSRCYILGFISCATLFGVTSVNYVIEQGAFLSIRRTIKKFFY